MYEINVAKRIGPEFLGDLADQNRYEHLFTTDASRSGNSWMLAQVLPKLREAFPAPAFSVTVRMVRTTSEEVSEDTIKRMLKEHS